jgi:hypothetical protein
MEVREMSDRDVKKTLIDPKVRLLLWICLKKEIKDESNYLKKLADKIDYSGGSIRSHFIPELIRENLIESLSPDKRSPPYRATDEAKKLLAPIFFVRTVGILFTIFVAVIVAALPWYVSNLSFLFYWYLPWITIGFAFLVIVLILYPYFLLKAGKIAFPK